MKTLLGSAACIGAAVFGLQTTDAQVLIFGNSDPGGNFVQPTDPNAAYFFEMDQSGGSNGQSRGVGFTTGGTTFTLDHIDVTLFETASTTLPRMQIYGGTAAGPSGAALATLSPNPQPVTSTSATYSFTGAFTLSANTTYWVAVANVSGATGSLVWGQSDTSTGTPPAASNGSGYTSQGSFVNLNSDDLAAAAPNDGFADTSASPNFAVYATAVPEPHQYALIAGLGLCSFAALRRRRAVRA